MKRIVTRPPFKAGMRLTFRCDFRGGAKGALFHVASLRRDRRCESGWRVIGEFEGVRRSMDADCFAEFHTWTLWTLTGRAVNDLKNGRSAMGWVFFLERAMMNVQECF